jgi:hypothetical protein
MVLGQAAATATRGATAQAVRQGGSDPMLRGVKNAHEKGRGKEGKTYSTAWAETRVTRTAAVRANFIVIIGVVGLE